MNFRNIIHFFKSPAGRGVLITIGIFTFVLVMYMSSDREADKIADPGRDVFVGKKKEIRINGKVTRFVPAVNEKSKKEPFKKQQIALPTGKTVAPEIQRLLNKDKYREYRKYADVLNDLSEDELENLQRLDKGAFKDNPSKRRKYLRQLVKYVKQRHGHDTCRNYPHKSGKVKTTKVRHPINRGVLPISLYNAPVKHNTIVTNHFAPNHRLIICELVTTIDSARINSPVVGLVAEPVCHEGIEVIPAGTEVHGWASKSAMRDRIAADGNWTLIWRDMSEDSGKELSIRGLALTYTKVPGVMKWDITDGSAGIKGYVVNERDWTDLVSVAAVFIQGVGQGMVSRTLESYGDTTTSTTGGTTKDAIGQGLANAASLYAQRMLEAIERDGAFIRVPAGTLFYLYTLEPINMDKATIAGSMVVNHKNNGGRKF